MSFNTVNGKYCCNIGIFTDWTEAEACFNTVNGKYCCNGSAGASVTTVSTWKFQYRKR